MAERFNRVNPIMPSKNREIIYIQLVGYIERDVSEKLASCIVR